ncbi:unnamed protein product [Rotaria magnacalcarata]|uniref:Uncharacterized protein n=2 Tax=Rotaria magnacalcarata TaxID=392030 RepID=A0A820G9S2_9BILA|nr:unnamed protein product [Rotaria magnacalcarata]CAF4274585.1 unnamed protein product [Rotaria magnacalcarata]
MLNDVRTDVYNHRDKIIEKADNYVNDGKEVISQLRRDLHIHREETIQCFNQNVNNLRQDVKNMCMHVSNLVQLSSIILCLLVILGKLYENNDLNINSFINFSSYIAVIGILIQYMYVKLTGTSLDIVILQSFFMIIIFSKLFIMIKSFVESHTHIYYISLIYYSFSINIPNGINIQILYCFIDICFYISIVGIVGLFIKEGISNDYSRKGINEIHFLFYGIMYIKFAILLSQFIHFILKKWIASIPYQILGTSPIFIALLELVDDASIRETAAPFWIIFVINTSISNGFYSYLIISLLYSYGTIFMWVRFMDNYASREFKSSKTADWIIVALLESGFFLISYYFA